MIIYNVDAMIPLWLFISIQPTINLQTQARLIYDMLTKKNNAAKDVCGKILPVILGLIWLHWCNWNLC